MDAFWWNVLCGIALAGLVAPIMNIRTALFLGMAVAVLVVCAIFVISLSTIYHLSGWELVKELFTKSGSVVSLLLLLLFYTMFCVLKNKEYIEDGAMPDTWYLFSYFVVAVTALDIMAIVAYMKDQTSSIYNALSMLLTTILLGFVIIETIICSYYRTDGFEI